MVLTSAANALGSHAPEVRLLVVKTVRALHNRFAEAHQASGSRYTMGFGSQWRDLLDDVYDALQTRGYRTLKLAPGGYKLPVVNDCLVYVWRVPGSVDAVSSFASSPTRQNGFVAKQPDPTLFEPDVTGEPEPAAPASEKAELERMVRAAGDTMPVVLVMVHSSPRQLRSIEWAVAEFDRGTGEVKLHGRECIWEPELNVDVVDATTDVESFDSGIPNGPKVEPQEQEGTEPDA
jgi:hypothetical protein